MVQQHSLPVHRGAAEYSGWVEHRDLGCRLRLRLVVVGMSGDGEWQGEWEAAGHQRERVNISFLEGCRLTIWNAEGRHRTELRGRATWRGKLAGEVCQDGVSGGAFRLWPMACGAALRQQLRVWYVALRSGSCEEVSSCEADGLPEQCTICMEEFAPGDMISEMPCPRARHIFHRRCVHEWLRSHDTCPLCRFELQATVSMTSSISMEASTYWALIATR